MILTCFGSFLPCMQVVELLATDYLASSLPKEHVPKALDVIARFAVQVGR